MSSKPECNYGTPIMVLDKRKADNTVMFGDLAVMCAFRWQGKTMIKTCRSSHGSTAINMLGMYCHFDNACSVKPLTATLIIND